MARLWGAAALVLLATACTGGGDEPAGPPSDVAATAAAETDGSAAAVADTAAAPEARIGFHGYGDAAFGADEDAVRAAFAAPLKAGELDEDYCYYLQPDDGGQPGFMIHEGRFARYDVWDQTLRAPGGLAVGMHADEVLARFSGRVEQQPHKYDEASRYLIVTPEGDAPARLVFEVGGDGIISTWRIGLPPAVFFVEGCS